MLTFACGSIQAQFYDSEDEVRFYVADRFSPTNTNIVLEFCVFNFNGDKGAMISHDYKKILEDENYFEKKIISNPDEIIEYSRSESSYDTTSYYETHGWSVTGYFIFTENRKHLVHKTMLFGSEHRHNYTLVSKEKFIELILIYEKNKNSWR